MKRFFLFLVLVAISTQLIFSQKREDIQSSYPDYKNPGYSMCMSMILPGLGQFYNRDLTKGFCLVGSTALSTSLIALSGSDGMLIFGITLLSATWAYAVVDAPISSHLKNKKNGVSFRVLPNIENKNSLNSTTYGVKLALTF